MVIFFVIFLVVSVALIPFAWIISVVDKLSTSNSNYTPLDKVFNYLFILFGPLILTLDVLSDLNYFWKNNFRTELKMNIIVKEDSRLTHASLRDLDRYSYKMGSNKIKSLTTLYLVRHFRNKLKC